MNNDYALYLRKSRADYEAELRGEGETLARHRTALLQLAARRGLNVVKIYEEIGSADTIASRPQMQALLSDVESGKYAGVIVNDADRLARGDGIDQGIVKQAFYSTGTLIVTPLKTFNPADDADEDFFDFSLFMARFEYRKINQRMQTGRARSAAEGNYLGTRVTYGYRKVKRTDQRGFTLEIDPERAEIVRMIFAWYAYGENGHVMSSDAIAHRLRTMGIKTTLGYDFDADGVRNILKNPSYIGHTSWAKKIKKVSFENGVRIVKRVRNPNPIVCDNAHPAIIDMQTWNDVRNIFATHMPLPKNTLTACANVLSGLVKCKYCGKTMQRKPGAGGRPDILRCVSVGCPTTGIYIPTLEDAILSGLENWLIEYSSPGAKPASPAPANSRISALEKQISTLRRQLNNLHDLVEQGVYTVADFVRRRDDINGRIDDAQAQLQSIANSPTHEDLIRAELPRIKHVLESYPLVSDLERRNQLLKSVISYVEYDKTKKCCRNDNPADYLFITIFPQITS